MNWGEFIEAGRTQTPEFEIAFRLLLACLFGAAIGFERELRHRPAGLRTHTLTALAAAVFTVLTFEIYYDFRQAGDQTARLDPLRLIEAVTAGVAFLAAGTIIHSRGRVHGLTTGAGIWLAGAVGVACGAGYYSVALMGSALAVTIFLAMRRFERHVLDTKQGKSPD